MSALIPKYALYGDAAQPAWLDMVHTEQICERHSAHDFEIGAHVHEGLIHVLYMISGESEVFVDGSHWLTRAPALIVIPAGHVHGFHSRHDIDGPVVTAAQGPLESLVAAAAPGLLAHLRKPRVLDLSYWPNHASVLPPLFQSIAGESLAQARGEIAAGHALLMAVLVQIARMVSLMRPDENPYGSTNHKAEVIERFRALVGAQFHNRWPITRYAESLGLSAGQLSRLCRDLLGASALDVVNARIVQEAERELVYSGLSIKQIAGRLGFADDAYFGRFFRKHTGWTPSSFRQTASERLTPR